MSLALAALLAVTVVAVPALASHDNGDANPATTTIGEQPEQKPGNDSESCDVGEFFFRIEGDNDGGTDADLESGAYPAPGGAVFNLQVPTDGPIHVGDPKTLDFWVEGGSVAEVRLKGGPNGYNEYDYVDHSDENTDGENFTGLVNADDYLHSPPGPQPGTFGGLSHISFCYDVVGQLEVQKFIDVDADGVFDDGLDVASGDTNLAGWEFDVFAGDSTDPADLITTLVTDSDGKAGPIDLAAGTYTVVEANSGTKTVVTVTGEHTTELTSDGDAILDNKSTKGVVAGETTTYTFGNACLITKVFEIEAAQGTENVMAFYDSDLTDNAISADATFVALSDPDNDGTFTGTAPDLFQVGNEIEWGFGLDTNNDGSLADEDPGFIGEISDESFTVADGYPACLKTNEGDLPNPQIEATKFKDANDDGATPDVGGTLDGWTISLHDSSGTLIDSGVTGDDGDGAVLFDNLTIGASYIVCEDLASQPNWLQTHPTDTDEIVNPDDCHEVGPLEIGETAEVEFHNTPLSEIRVGFTDLTGFTDVTITCFDPEGNIVFTQNTVGEVDEDEDFTVFDDYRIRQGTLSCDFEVEDP